MTPHGPDTATYELAISPASEGPSHLGYETLAFMFETYLTPRVTAAALGSPQIDRNYYKCWMGLQSHFDRNWTPPEDPVNAPGDGDARPTANGNGNAAVKS